VTFSIVACDAEQQQMGVAVASKFLAVGAAVPFYGVGEAVPSQYSGLTAAVQGHYGEQDSMYPPDAARATEQQIGLSRPQRASNVQGAFKVAPERSADIAGRRVVLVDDVLTSGATTDACARALLRAKAAQVDVLVFARVVDTHRAPI